ncbi:MAG: DUF4215 domain-containing protein, partial [Myxococcota bacterium]|nr:DUF4215 domain-containing protein [Myxococcota bacterium]
VACGWSVGIPRDGDGYDFDDYINDAIGHVSTAKAYWDARTEAGENSDFNAGQMNWGPSLRRSVSAIRAMGSARRNDAPGTLRTHETDLAAAMRQEVKVFVRDTISTRASADGAPGYWTAIRDLASSAIDSAADQAAGQPKAVASADAYDKLAAMYDSRYSAENRISAAQIDLDAAIDEEVDERPRDELTAALNSVVRYGLKLEIKLARDTNAAGRAQLDLVLTSIGTVAGCMAGLQSNSLNDHDFTECYQEVIIILKKLREVQGALIDTTTWRGLLGVGVYAMLDISIYHTENSLVTREGVDEDEEAQEGISQYRAGLAEIRAGNTKTAIQRYINNECRIIDLYNRYWAGPGNAVIDNTDACARVCGNSQVEEGEQCDDGNFTDTDGCTTNCQRNVCGDGSLYSGREACDDGNRINSDGCTNVCAVARCGDSVVRAGTEECDDGNLVNDDNCSNECVSARCGDSIRQGAEECDDGDQNNTNSCSNTCTLNAAKIAAGYYHTCFLRGGNVYCSGYNPYGQLGDGSTTQRTSAVQVRNLSNVKAIAAGLYHTCAVKTDGTAWCWGYGGHGQLGNGSTSVRVTPVQVRGLTGITQIAAGHIHTCARKSNGTLFCWGYNYYGQNGAGNYTNNNNSPVQVGGISNAKSVSAGIFHSCATLTTGAVKCWGYGTYHQTTNTSSRPSRTASPRTISGMTGIRVVEAYGYGSCALRNNGTVGCWGYGCHGQMGNARSSCYNYGNLTVQNLTGAAEIGGGYYHMCGRQSDGAVKCWGYNSYGQLGDGSTTNRNTAVAVRGMTDAVAISHSSQAWHSCASRRDGSVACWGKGDQGQLGVGSTSNSTTPVNVIGAAGGDVGVGNAANNPGRSCKQIKTARATANQR